MYNGGERVNGLTYIIVVAGILMAKGVDVTFEMTEGGHNCSIIPRFEKSVVSFLGNQ